MRTRIPNTTTAAAKTTKTQRLPQGNHQHQKNNTNIIDISTDYFPSNSKTVPTNGNHNTTNNDKAITTTITTDNTTTNFTISSYSFLSTLPLTITIRILLNYELCFLTVKKFVYLYGWANRGGGDTSLEIFAKSSLMSSCDSFIVISRPFRPVIWSLAAISCFWHSANYSIQVDTLCVVTERTQTHIHKHNIYYIDYIYTAYIICSTTSGAVFISLT